MLNLQINYQMEPDVLFPVKDPIYIPIYSLSRKSNWTDEQADA